MQLCVEAVVDDEVAPTAPKGNGTEAFGSKFMVRGSPLRNPPRSNLRPLIECTDCQCVIA
jgi:hypothetical protein